tara:strand:+ start:128 stop:1105 length:978 start_codon:yes stop_codon:yes gene_type:complete
MANTTVDESVVGEQLTDSFVNSLGENETPSVTRAMLMLRIAIWLAMILAFGLGCAKLVPSSSKGPLRASLAIVVCHLASFLGCIFGAFEVLAAAFAAVVFDAVRKHANWTFAWTFTKQHMMSVIDVLLHFVEAPLAAKFWAVALTIRISVFYTTVFVTAIWLYTRVSMFFWQYLWVPLLKGADKLMGALLQMLPPKVTGAPSYYGMASHPVAIGSLYLTLGHQVNFWLLAYYASKFDTPQGVATEVLTTIFLATIVTAVGGLYIHTLMVANDAFIPKLDNLAKKMEFIPLRAIGVICGLIRSHTNTIWRVCFRAISPDDHMKKSE